MPFFAGQFAIFMTQNMQIPVKVIANEAVSNDTRRVDLLLPQWASATWLAGQYLDVILDDGGRRSFSIANAEPVDGTIQLYIKRVDGGVFTGYVFEHLTLNTIWVVELPFGAFVVHDSERPIVLLAGSSGIAPVLAMLAKLAADNCNRHVHVYWGQRFASDFYASDQIDEWVSKSPTMSYTPVVSQADDSWQGSIGYVQDIAVETLTDLADFDIYISGSPNLVSAAVEKCLAAGAQEAHIFQDIFSFQSVNANECLEHV